MIFAVYKIVGPHSAIIINVAVQLPWKYTFKSHVNNNQSQRSISEISSAEFCKIERVL